MLLTGLCTWTKHERRRQTHPDSIGVGSSVYVIFVAAMPDGLTADLCELRQHHSTDFGARQGHLSAQAIDDAMSGSPARRTVNGRRPIFEHRDFRSFTIDASRSRRARSFRAVVRLRVVDTCIRVVCPFFSASITFSTWSMPGPPRRSATPQAKLAAHFASVTKHRGDNGSGGSRQGTYITGRRGYIEIFDLSVLSGGAVHAQSGLFLGTDTTLSFGAIAFWTCSPSKTDALLVKAELFHRIPVPVEGRADPATWSCRRLCAGSSVG